MADSVESHSIERRSVFVSHAHADNELCDRYVGALVSRGIDVWYDRNNLQAGNQLSVEIQHQLQRRKAFIVMLSPASVASFWVQLETDTYRDLMADDLERILIPVRIEPCEVPALLRSLLWVDATDKPFDKAIDEIITALDAPARTSGLASELASKRGVSRRTMLFALAGATMAGVLGGGALTLLAGADGLISGGTSTRIIYAPTNTPAPTPTPGVGDALYTFTGHTARVTSVAWSPDGTRIASASDDGTVKVWSPTARSSVLTYRGHTGPVTSVAWSPDGTRIASAGSDHTVRVWNATTGGSTLTYKGHIDKVNSAAWSRDGKYILSTSNDLTFRIWSPTSLQTIHTYFAAQLLGYSIAATPITCMSGAWSSGGTHIAVAADTSTSNTYAYVIVLDWASGAQITGYFIGIVNGLTTVAWSPNGEFVAAAGNAQAIAIWNPASAPNNAGASFPATNSVISYQGHYGRINSVMWSPDGKRMASCASDQTVQVWNPLTAQTEFTSHLHTAAVNSVCWSPEGTRIVSGSDDKTVKVIRAR